MENSRAAFAFAEALASLALDACTKEREGGRESRRERGDTIHTPVFF